MNKCSIVCSEGLTGKHLEAKVSNSKQELTGVFGQLIAEMPTQVIIKAVYVRHDLTGDT